MVVSVLHCLRSKERLSRGIARTNNRLIRSIICQDDVHFEKIWESQSSSSSSYESQRFYFDNYRVCLAGCGFKGKPSTLYKLPKCPTSQKIEDAIVCQHHTEEVSEETRPHLIALTKDNWIIRYHLDTGRLLQRIYLGPQLNFNYLNWNEEGHSFAVRTTKTQISSTPINRQPVEQSNVLLTMAVFTVYPLELQACFEVDKRVFGNDVIGAHLEGGNIFFTLHHREVVKFYSFERILEENVVDPIRLGDSFPDGGAEGCKIGAAPRGIPITLRIKERPAILFEVSCHDHDVQFGGNPWHFMMSPRSQLEPAEIKVCSLATKDVATNGILERNTLAAGTPGAIFHFDGSDRIINTRVRSMSVYKLRKQDGGQSELVLDHVIKPWPYEDMNYLEEDARGVQAYRIEISHRGRPHKVSHEFWDGDGLYGVLTSQMICNFTCDDEMDLMAVTMPTHNLDTDSLHGYVTFHDNATGRLLKMIPMPGEWDDTIEHQVSIHLDTLVHTFKNQSGKWCCEVFRAQRKSITKEKSKARGKKGVTKGHRKGRRR